MSSIEIKLYFPGEGVLWREFFIQIGNITRNYGDRDIRGNSGRWKNWQCWFTLTTCVECMEQHGTIYPYDSEIQEIHPNGKCTLVPMRTIFVGTVTNQGISGVDAFLEFTGHLPQNYINKETARQHGWRRRRGNLANVLPGYQLGGDIFENNEGKLPSSPGRIWYEADFNYTNCFRNDCRILYSSDNLIFVSYDHYKTFFELI